MGFNEISSTGQNICQHNSTFLVYHIVFPKNMMIIDKLHVVISLIIGVPQHPELPESCQVRLAFRRETTHQSQARD